MWPILKTIFLTLIAWSLATVGFALIATLTWTLGSTAFGLAVPGFLPILGATGTLVTLVAVVRFAFTAPLLSVDREVSYGTKYWAWSLVVWRSAACASWR